MTRPQINAHVAGDHAVSLQDVGNALAVAPAKIDVQIPQ